ncbi:acyl-CoA dehydrogenase family protein, partial [Hydrogenophaga sp.]|nr:acyl-CoA dehydrogenase [Hydrogenophaga sp.]
MNPNDLPRELTHEASANELLAAVRAVAQGPLADVVEACDRNGFYPRDVLQQLGAMGAFSAHLDAPVGRAD